VASTLLLLVLVLRQPVNSNVAAIMDTIEILRVRIPVLFGAILFPIGNTKVYKIIQGLKLIKVRNHLTINLAVYFNRILLP